MVAALPDSRARGSTIVTIRADASEHVGTGHIVRMFSLASALARRNARIRLVAREVTRHLEDGAAVLGIDVVRITSADDDATATATAIGTTRGVCVVDHYGLDARWERAVRPHCDLLVVIDDLADRPHDCDLLVDQNHHTDPAARYAPFVPSRTELLLGPRYALLRPQFARERARVRDDDHAREPRLFVCFGGSDPTNETYKALEGIAASRYRDVAVDVVLGGANAHARSIDAFDGLPQLTVFHSVEDVAAVMARATIAIGAGGTMTWERCALGLPSILAVLADNQVDLTASLAADGTVASVGWSTNTTPAIYRAALDNLDPDALERMRRQSMALVDALGADRVAERILSRALAEASPIALSNDDECP